MSPTLSIGNFIILIGAVQGIFLSLLLWSLKKGNKTAHRFLAVFLFIFSLQMIYFVVWDSRMILQIPHFSMVLAPLDFALGPLFYFYSLALTQKKFRFERRDAFHFIFVVVGYAYFSKFYFETALEKIDFNLKSYDRMPELWSGFSFVSIVQTSLYTGLTLLVLLRHVRTVKKYYSSIEQIDLGWIRTIMLVIVGGFLSCLLISFIGFKWANYYSNIIFSFAIYAMGYYGMRQQSIFADISEEVTADEPEPVVIKAEEQDVILKKYEKSGLTEERAIAYLERLDQLMTKEKYYLDPDLTLQQLADIIGISLHHLSQILNQYKQQNFFDYINQLRVEEFKLEVVNPLKQHLSLLAIAFDCGFNSKAAFNIAFKKYTGLTPSAYRNQVKAEEP